MILGKIMILTLVGTLHVENTVFKGNLHAHTGAIPSAPTCAGFRQRLGRYYHVVHACKIVQPMPHDCCAAINNEFVLNKLDESR
jgi:hypothetical protein